MTTFEEYEEFIYVNTKMDRNEARIFARECWNRGMTKYDALAEARKMLADHDKKENAEH